MPPNSRTSSPEEMYLDHNTKTQPRSPTKSEDSGISSLLNSRGRRLFPQRRTSLSASARRDVNATPCFSPFEPSPSNDRSYFELAGIDSKTSRSNSVDSINTVKVHMSPTSTWPVPNAAPRFGRKSRVRMPCLAGSLQMSCGVENPITPPHSSDNSSVTNFSMPLYTDTLARGNLQWKSMAQFHKSRHGRRPRILSQLPDGEQASCISHESKVPFVPTIEAFSDTIPLDTGSYHWSQSPSITAGPGLLHNEVSQNSGREERTYATVKDYSCPEVPPIEITTCDCTVKLSTVATVATDGRLHVHHLAILSVMMPIEKLYAQDVRLSFVVSNALRADHECSLGLGQSSLLFREDVSQPGLFPREGVQLVIVRKSRDLEKPLNLYFAFTYQSPWHFVMVSLPTFRPKQGRSLSEVVFIAEPLPPLSIRTCTRDPLSNWKLCHHTVGEVICYKRINMPLVYPDDIQDDIQISILKLDPVHFRALGQSTLANLVWKLEIMVNEVFEGQFHCQMKFFVEVGAATAAVSLISHGWVPQYFIVGGCVATEKAGECWRDKEGHIIILKQPHMGPGPIMIETHWRGPPNHGKKDGSSTDSLYLPGIAKRKLLGGRLTCQANERRCKIILLNYLGEKVRPYDSIDGTSTELPTMDPGYRIRLKCVAETDAQKLSRLVAARSPCLPTPEHTQPSEKTDINSDVEFEKERGAKLGCAVDKVQVKAASPSQLFQRLLLAILVLLLLVPGFLLFVDYVRKENEHVERTGWRDEDLSGRDGEMQYAVIEVVEPVSLQPAVVVVDEHVEVAKCKGWRDWVDYVSGWQGCVP